MVKLEFDRVFREEYPKLVALGISVTGDREVARELAQETMLRAHSKWSVLEGYENPPAWLRRVMSNLLIDHHRSRGTERVALERLRPAVAEAPGPPETAWAELIAPLTPLQRVVATLFYAEDRSVLEIAAELDLSPGTVKSTLSKIRRRLRKATNVGGAS
jgi:RNA polymerase sigma-70 factor, ECF subfamily